MLKWAPCKWKPVPTASWAKDNSWLGLKKCQINSFSLLLSRPRLSLQSRSGLWAVLAGLSWTSCCDEIAVIPGFPQIWTEPKAVWASSIRLTSLPSLQSLLNFQAFDLKKKKNRDRDGGGNPSSAAQKSGKCLFQVSSRNLYGTLVSLFRWATWCDADWHGLCIQQYARLCTSPPAQKISFNPPTALWSRNYYPYFTKEEIGSQGSYFRSQSGK